MKVLTAMESKVSKLPHFNIVKQWDISDVCQWLSQNDFHEFIETFKTRFIDGIALLELNQDRVIVQFTEQKITKRRQLAKCVTECKAQATQAKSAVNRIKKRSKSGNFSTPPPIDQGDFDNEWDTDFEDDDDEEDVNSFEVENNNNFVEDSEQLQISTTDDKNDTSSSSSPGTFRSVWNLHNSSQQQTSGSEDITLQKITIASEDLPVKTPFPKPPNTMLKVEQSTKFAIPRRPATHHIQRPPSQPPPPPSPNKEESEDEYYEVPNSGVPSSYLAAKPPQKHPSPPPSKAYIEDADDTYEIMDVPEETYEAVDENVHEDEIQEKRLQPTETPPLPAKLLSSGLSLPPPPLPSKPKQLIGQQMERRHSGTSLVEKMAKDLDEKLRGNRYPIQTPGNIVIRVQDKKNDPQNALESPALSGAQEALDDQNKSSGAIRKTPPPVHVVKPILQQRMSTADAGRLLTNRPLPPVPNITSNEENLSSLPFFHEIERDDAEVLIGKMASDGSFLIRPSKRAGQQNPYTITLMHDGLIFHINIRRRNDGLFALGREKPQEQTFCDIKSLVTYHKSCPIVLTLKGELSGRQYLRETPQK